MIEILKEISTGRLAAVCEECYNEYESAEKAVNDVDVTFGTFGRCQPAEFSEIRQAGWDKYVTFTREYDNPVTSATAQSDIIGVIPFSPARDAPLSQVRAAM